jgi:NAD(P)H-dependent nitrite reductase small subunit
MAQYQKVALISEIAPGNSKVVEVDEKVLAIFNVGGAFYATDNTCPHRQGPLGEGSLDGKTVSCPWHGWKFDVTTGNCRTNPLTKLTTYPLRVEGDAIMVQI